MTVYKVTLRELQLKLGDIPKKDRAALQKAFIAARPEVDVAIQWAIRGGGRGAGSAIEAGEKEAERVDKKRAAATKQRTQKGAQTKFKVKGGRSRTTPVPKANQQRSVPTYRVPIDRGDYAGSFRTRAEGNTAVIYSVAKPLIKAAVIEKGRKKAPIPIRPLAGWVQRKLGVTNRKQALGIAIAISKTAMKKRRAGLGVIERARPRIVKAIKARVVKELAIARASRI